MCAELATGHHGDVAVALEMIHAAAEAGCDAVKIQHYGAVNPSDPQAQWLNESRFSEDDIYTLKRAAKTAGLAFWATAFDATVLRQLYSIGVDCIKIASSEAEASWWHFAGRERDVAVAVAVSWPWGRRPDNAPYAKLNLTAIPVYPTPIECVGQAELLAGWSDHTVGTQVCKHMISRYVEWLEVHMTLGERKSRVCAWDKSPDQLRELREYAGMVATIRSGVSQTFRDRWRA